MTKQWLVFSRRRVSGSGLMKLQSFLTAVIVVSAMAAETPTELPQVIVFSPRVANQSPAATFAMPVSALRYEPRVDLQGRNLVEGQADVTIRGGIFENTGFRVGALSVLDPQTGHYFADIPIAPQMLGAPEILTGVGVALEATNATVGGIAYNWRPITTRGVAQVGAGPHGLWRGDLYQGAVISGPTRVGIDLAAAHSESNGPVAFGDHRFDRLNGRVQLAGASWQSDVFAGYQSKIFGWPNLYTPFNSNEAENLQTLLLAVNHHVDLGGGEFFNAGAFHRRNKDDYAFNRLAALGPTHPFQHTTWMDGAAVETRRSIGQIVLNTRAEVMVDFLKSTSLTAGRYHARSLWKAGLIPERSWIDAGHRFTAKAGVTYDDSNRDEPTLSPIAEIAWETPGAPIRRVYASYARSTQLPTYTALNSSAGAGLFRGNPDLGREISNNIELGASALVAGWTADAAVFVRDDQSLVDWTFRRGVTARSANAVDVGTLGFELVARHSWSRVDLVLGYTALTKDPDYRGAAVDASFYALNYAKHRLTTAATVRLGHGLELRMDNVARAQAENLLRTVGGQRALFSTVALAYRPAWIRGAEVSVQVDNLWNSRFQEVPAVPASPREWSVGASYLW